MAPAEVTAPCRALQEEGRAEEHMTHRTQLESCILIAVLRRQINTVASKGSDPFWISSDHKCKARALTELLAGGGK